MKAPGAMRGAEYWAHSTIKSRSKAKNHLPKSRSVSLWLCPCVLQCSLALGAAQALCWGFDFRCLPESAPPNYPGFGHLKRGLNEEDRDLARLCALVFGGLRRRRWADSRVRDLVDFDGLVEAQDDDLAAGDTQKQDEAEEDSAQSDQDAADQGSETAGDFDLIDEDIELIFSQPGALEEEQPFTMSFGVEPSSARLYALNLPPGASWDVATRTLSFTPDFTQGGRDYSIDLQAVGEQGRRSFSLDIAVNDSIAPPAPRVVDTQYGDGFVRLRVEQTTDTFLDSPGYAGRTFSAYVMAPSEASSAAPLRCVWCSMASAVSLGRRGGRASLGSPHMILRTPIGGAMGRACQAARRAQVRRRHIRRVG